MSANLTSRFNFAKLMCAIQYLHARNDIFVVSLCYNWWPLLTCMLKWNIWYMMH